MLVVAEREQLPVADARAGNAEAWKTLFRRYRLPLYVYVFELVRDEQASLDLVQETFINAFRHIASLREDDKFGGWLFRIAHQKCVQQWRRQGREAELREEMLREPETSSPDPLDVLVREEQEAEFMRQLEKIPLPQRSALLLHFIEGFSLEEIARITGTQVGTVKSRLHYAKRALRKLLEEEAP
ncbi:MAG TPA: RNA polymerase sigma factor [Verrucomicrobiae bacterium]|nr:RNA polymerase sigma factor [Verrucomicrobiae bacterium]